ncbi:sensor histidine kinase [Evansella halocellulosilytica]|uniref:sensor histidine kinase n=1 Tax=Evansella halocellulosilytica TaxID=2011013 RepID=UPI000BB711A4|nr:HAMP domain-containing sensor histidine kinase [Evansella halocellulosilytica]
MEIFLQFLLNLFVLLTPIFLYVMFWKGLKLHHHTTLTKLFFFFLCMVTIIFIMLFPIRVEIMQNILPFDFQFIPIFVATLLGGWIYGIPLIIVQSSTNFILYDLEVMLFGLCAATFIFFGAYWISLRYNKFEMKKRSLVTLAVFFSPIMIILFFPTNPLMLPLGESLIVGIVYASVTGLIALLILSLINLIQTSEQLEKDLQKSEQLRLVSELAASVAHEVRNPMTVARGFIQLIHSNSKLTDDEKKYLQLTISELDRAQSIISDYLSLAKPKEKVNEPVLVYHVMDKVRHTVQAYALMNNVSVFLDVPTHLKVKADDKELTQVLLNLAKNGIEAMEHGGSLFLTGSQKESHVILKVKDTGCGMTNEQVKRLGTAYYSTKEKGTGLGLMITYNLIRSWGGQVTVNSKVDIGTEFIIQLPAAFENEFISSKTSSQSV